MVRPAFSLLRAWVWSSLGNQDPTNCMVQPKQLLLTAEKRNCSTIIAREFNTTLSTMDTDQTENQYGNSLNNITDERNLTTHIEYSITWLQNTHSFKHTGTFSMIDYILGHKQVWANLGDCKHSIFFDCNIYHQRRKSGNCMKTCKLNSTLPEQHQREIKLYLETDKKKPQNTTY